MKKTSLVISVILLFSLIFVVAHSEEDFAQAEEIIQQKISCDELTEEQLELIGDYYMEQMHPGEAHEVMDEMMGGEGSESLRLMHVNMGLTFYCGQHEAMSLGMMDMMIGRMDSENMMGTSRNYGVFGIGFFGWFFMLLIAVALVLLIVWLIKQIQRPRRRK